jgi:hypothetical protein
VRAKAPSQARIGNNCALVATGLKLHCRRENETINSSRGQCEIHLQDVFVFAHAPQTLRLSGGNVNGIPRDFNIDYRRQCGPNA